jgi:hypothetical protein
MRFTPAFVALLQDLGVEFRRLADGRMQFRGVPPHLKTAVRAVLRQNQPLLRALLSAEDRRDG